jgi:hypothetical protein
MVDRNPLRRASDVSGLGKPDPPGFPNLLILN